MNILVENIRSFDGKYSVPIKPITLLVGENSAGKSTFLSTIYYLSEKNIFPFKTNFNDPPFELGSFNTIATYKGGKYGRAKYFTLGYEINTDGIKVNAKYVNELGQPKLFELEIISINSFVRVRFENDQVIAGFRIKDKTVDNIIIDKSLIESIGLSSLEVLLSVGYVRQNNKNTDTSEILMALSELFQNLSPNSAIPIAPIRTKPERTYNQVIENFNPEGRHIPQLLAKLYSSENKDKSTVELLNWFGKESGLFNSIGIKHFGDKSTDPFQINTEIYQRLVNLLDVGYGVSQSLPVIVESILSKNKILLIQQPEVHLHPKAQATLGSFFVKLSNSGAKNLIIETHSDFIIDRIRQEVAQGNISNDSISILYFHKPKYETKIYPISLDKKGNIIDAPSFYRDFFLKEGLKLFKR